jgi:hypothetical protein
MAPSYLLSRNEKAGVLYVVMGILDLNWPVA